MREKKSLQQRWGALCAGLLAVGMMAVPLPAQADELESGAKITDVSESRAESTGTKAAPNDLITDKIDDVLGTGPSVRHVDGPEAQSDAEPRGGTSENVPAGARSEAPIAAARGITFLDTAEQEVPQQSPSYDGDAMAVDFDTFGDANVAIDGVRQNYTAAIPFWCNASNDGGKSLHLCYRNTDLYNQTAWHAATGDHLSIIDGKPHVIFDDEAVTAKMSTFLNTGALQLAMDSWNKLLGKDFFLVKSRITFVSGGEAGKFSADATRDYLQYIQLAELSSDVYAGSANQYVINLNLKQYDDDMAYFDEEMTSTGIIVGSIFSRKSDTDPKNRGVGVTWGYSCGGYVTECITSSTKEGARKNWADYQVRSWANTLEHEMGHLLGLNHPANGQKDTYNPNENNTGMVNIYGPLMMQYQRDNFDSMLDSSLETSVEYRMIKDLITAGKNYILSNEHQKSAVLQRNIKVNVTDTNGVATAKPAPLASQMQRVGYYGSYRQYSGSTCPSTGASTRSATAVMGTGSITGLCDAWNPTGPMPAVAVPKLAGYKVSIDGGNTWSDSATIPAYSPSEAKLRPVWVDASYRAWVVFGGRNWPVENFGLTNPPDVQVTYKPVAVSADEVSATTDQGKSPTLPAQVKVHYGDGSAQMKNVTWAALDWAHQAAGTVTVTGTVAGEPSLTARATVKVVVVPTRIDEVTARVDQGKSPSLPTTVTVHYSDGSQASKPVQWQSKDWAHQSAGTADVYGTVDGISALKAHATVTVVAVPTAVGDVVVAIDQGQKPALPAQVKVRYSDGSVVLKNVTWEVKDWTAQQPGKVTVTGTIAGIGSLKVHAIVTVNAIAIEATCVQATTNQGQRPDLPSTVQVAYSDGSTKVKTVTWKSVDWANQQPGTVDVTGTIEGIPSLVAHAYVTVKAVPVSVESVTARVDQGQAPQLPAQVKVTYSDKTTVQKNVTWNEVNWAAQQPGTVDVPGTVADIPASLKAHAKVTVVAIPVSVESVTATVDQGQAPPLPSQVKVTYSDGTTAMKAVTWDKTVDWAHQQVGTVNVSGVVVGVPTSLKALAKVTVKAVPVSVERVTATVDQGKAPTLPAQVKVTYSDGTTAMKAVTWDKTVDWAHQNVGMVDVPGTVAGVPASLKAVASVKVNAVPQSVDPVSATVDQGKAPSLPAQVTVRYSDGSTVKKNVTWEVKDWTNQKPGTVNVSGTVSGIPASLKALAKVKVNAIPVAVESVTATVDQGKAPTLPSQVKVTYSDGTTAMKAVTWSNVDWAHQSVAAVDVSGTVAGVPASLKAHALVTVVAVPVSVDPIELTVDQGQTPKLPAQVTVRYSDGSSAQKNVTWDSVNWSKQKVGKVNVGGKAAGVSQYKAQAAVYVQAAKPSKPVTEPAKPQPSKPTPSQPAPSKPQPSKPAPSKPSSSQPSVGKPQPSTPAVPAAQPGLCRLAGALRYDTAGKVVSEAFPGRASTVVLASGGNYPDALAASGLAGALNAPVMLTDATALSSQAKDQITRLKPSRVVIVGGTSAMSKNVEQAVSKLVSAKGVSRVAGSTRYDTAAMIYEQGVKLGAKWSDTAIVSTGGGFADALSVSPYSYVRKAPIFLADSKTGLTAKTVSDVKARGFRKVIIVGGAKAVPSKVESQVKSGGVKTVDRVQGWSRYATSEAIAKYAVKDGTLGVSNPVFATGANFPDALAGGSLAGSRKSVLVLTNPADTKDKDVTATLSWIGQSKSSIKQAYILGGTSAVSKSMSQTISKSLGLKAE